MGTVKTKELSKLGYINDKARSLVINILSKHFKHHEKAELIELLKNIKNNPENYINDPITGSIADMFMEKEKTSSFETFSLTESTSQLKIYGNKEIEEGAKRQMAMAMALPVTVQGALMPDAHTGFGLP